MEPASKKPFRKTFSKVAYGNNFINESDLGPELTEDNCTPELWNILTEGDSDDDILKPNDSQSI